MVELGILNFSPVFLPGSLFFVSIWGRRRGLAGGFGLKRKQIARRLVGKRGNEVSAGVAAS